MSARRQAQTAGLLGTAELSNVAPVPRLALNVDEACSALGVSWDFWREHIAPEVRVVRRGRRKLIAVAELQQWLDKHAERVG